MQFTALYREISTLKEADHPSAIHTLKLPKALVEVGGRDSEAVEDFRKIIDVENFSLDWPTPFEREYECEYGDAPEDEDENTDEDEDADEGEDADEDEDDSEDED